MTNVPAPLFAPTGLTIPSESDILAGLLADFQAAFGGGLNPSPATPQGQLISSLAAILGANNDLLLQMVNQVDPALAEGRMQDAIARIYYLTRQPPLPTTVTAICGGAVGTIIPAGSLAMATDGTIYQNLGTATIGVAGTASVQFSAIKTGPISCPAGALNVIYRVVPGWDSITNPAPGVPGRDAETRAQFEGRRAASVALNASGILPAVRAAVLNVAGVVDAYVAENPNSSPLTIDGVTIDPHALYVAAYGGSDDDVAQAIWRHKPPGCGYTGNTTVTVEDSGSGYALPYPSYHVVFQRPDPLPIYFAVTIADNGKVPSDVLTQVRAVVANAFNGNDGGPRATIGSTIYALRFAAGIAALGSWAQIVSIAVDSVSSPTASSTAVTIGQIPTLDPANVTVSLV